MKNFLFVLFLFGFSAIASAAPTSESKSESNQKNKTVYQAKSEYVNVKFFTINDDETLYIKAKFFDLSTVSAVHIHTNYEGSSGPIIAWLATSEEWQHGVTQNTPLTNTTPSYSCCAHPLKKRDACDNNMCTLVAPPRTLYTKDLSFSTQYYKVKKKVCQSCPWICRGTFLDIHGKDFQQVYDCVIVGTTPGIDMLASVRFAQVN